MDDDTPESAVRRPGLGTGVVCALLLVCLCILTMSTLRYGFSARDKPTKIESVVASMARHWSIPSSVRERKNPVALSREVLADGQAHFADHCYLCHGNDGKGQTGMGKGMYPRTPDLTLPATQSLSDGELFAIIENGVRMTGMPGFGDGTTASAEASWKLVHFIRHLPRLTPEELAAMERSNPKSSEDWEQLEREAAFLAGGDEASSPAPTNAVQPHHH
ncbi:MAG: c-type cytochrome [Acidobacteriota bacterium]